MGIAEKMGWERREISFEGKSREVWNRGDIYLFECPPYEKSMSWAFEVMERERISLIAPVGGGWQAMSSRGSHAGAVAAECICRVAMMADTGAGG